MSEILNENGMPIGKPPTLKDLNGMPYFLDRTYGTGGRDLRGTAYHVAGDETTWNVWAKDGGRLHLVYYKNTLIRTFYHSDPSVSEKKAAEFVFWRVRPDGEPGLLDKAYGDSRPWGPFGGRS